MQKIVAMYYSYMKATMDYIFSQLCIFFPRVSNKATRGKESQHLRLRIRTTWTWEENHQMQKIVAMSDLADQGSSLKCPHKSKLRAVDLLAASSL